MEDSFRCCVILSCWGGKLILKVWTFFCIDFDLLDFDCGCLGLYSHQPQGGDLLHGPGHNLIDSRMLLLLQLVWVFQGLDR